MVGTGGRRRRGQVNRAACHCADGPSLLILRTTNCEVAKPMADQKIYAGVKLREARLKAGKTQKDFAAGLGVSLSYLNQMERNNRPLSAAVMLKLVQEYGFDVRTLSVDEADRMVADLTEAMVEPVFGPTPPHAGDLRLVATNAPAVAHAILNLYRAHRDMSERFAALDEALGEQGRDAAATPWEEVRDFFHYCDNYVDAVDRAAENFARTAGFAGPDKLAAGAAWLQEKHNVRVTAEKGAPLRHYDPVTRDLRLSADADPATRNFQLAHQVALLAHGDLLDATLDLAQFQSDEARSVARIGLANYFAGAATLPYGHFAETADTMRHDLERLAAHHGASLEQVAHRLSTLQRPQAKGIPFFFVRVDQAGTITKRHSATHLQFARYGGACPLWNVHRAFESSGEFLRQLAETPDGVKYFCLARDVSKPGGAFRAPARRYAIGLGCEIRHARHLVYADDLDISADAAFEPIGVSCRICERAECHQRSVPPLKHALSVDHNLRDGQPYRIGP